ncbi:aminotransferase class V-fold PLP-dependent enzyme [Paenibacillus contaminans]|uniref:cysteine desulfurase n=1 Tax=Paenibacillus contaminans TaxID=450362 RepID=A0A329MIH7_9BACL|nr:aminotransferase class V-fold PLP-dependent enzyme [Paenibacillus contaminans]RAV19520.1 cysteine desulfurase [Paenibacillus contaminans]
MKTYYFDHAASSWPKPKEVVEAMSTCVLEYAANPGRGSHQMAVKASRTMFETRKQLAKLFHIANPNDISFSLNTTDALNLAIKGFIRENDHVICTSIEHNSVRRPLEYLRRTKQIEITYVQADREGKIDPAEVQKAFKANTRLFVCSHSSNLLGTIAPIEIIAEMCRAKGVRLLVDAAQTAGTVPIDVQAIGIDMLAFPGHKGLLGPQGTGGLYVHPDIELEPLIHGGTGSQSEAIDQPSVRPDRYESGTQNTPGLAGLNEGVKFILRETVEKIHHKEWMLTQRIMEGLLGMAGVEVLGPKLGENKTGIVSFRMNGIDASETAFILDQSFQIAVRAGFHCTPLGHETAGTTETGAVRASVGYFTNEEDVDHLIYAIGEIGKHYT